MSIKIDQASNGYVVTSMSKPQVYVFSTLAEVFNYLLLHFDGKAATFSGELYGRVIIETTKSAFLSSQNKED